MKGSAMLGGAAQPVATCPPPPQLRPRSQRAAAAEWIGLERGGPTIIISPRTTCDLPHWKKNALRAGDRLKRKGRPRGLRNQGRSRR